MAGEGSFQDNYLGTTPGYQENDSSAEVESKFPKILIMGMRRSGKSSIQKVVFHKMSPNETLFLESTGHIVKEEVNNSSFVQFAIWDFPGQIDFFDPSFEAEKIFDNCGAVVFVIDAQDETHEPMQRFLQTVTKARETTRGIKFEVFIHKVDGCSEEQKLDAERDLSQQWSDYVNDNDSDMENIDVAFHYTSIYDHSIFEAFSKVVQKLINEVEALERMMNMFIEKSCVEKAYLFDVVTKICIASDSTPADMQSYELCCDMIDVVVDLSCIYGLNDAPGYTAFDGRGGSIIKLSNGTVLFLGEVSKVLALVCIIRQENFQSQGKLEYNFQECFKYGINEIFNVRQHIRRLKEDAARAGNSGDNPVALARSNNEVRC